MVLLTFSQVPHSHWKVYHSPILSVLFSVILISSFVGLRATLVNFTNMNKLRNGNNIRITTEKTSEPGSIIQFTVPPKNATIFVGSSWTFNCSYTPSKMGAHLKFYRGGIRNGVFGFHFSKEHEFCKARLNDNCTYTCPQVIVLENVTINSSDWYTCCLGSRFGLSCTSVYLSVVNEVETTEVEISHKKQAPTECISGNDHQKLVLVCSVVALSLILITVVIILIMRIIHERNALRVCDGTRSKKLIDEFAAVHIEDNVLPSEYILQFDIRWEIPTEDLILGEKVGEGEFGEVLKGELQEKDQLGNTLKTTVAVKRIKRGYNYADVADFVREVEIMKKLGHHENVVRLIGYCSKSENLFLIEEFAQYGNLRDFLRNYRTQRTMARLDYITAVIERLTCADLISFARQLACGMKFLAQNQLVHCDLAARNVLVYQDISIKVGDFGMAREVSSSDYYKKRRNRRVPVRWSAIESLLESVYTTQSDVWSYGIVLWEIFTFGTTPYPDVIESQKVAFLVQAGERLKKPENCPEEVFELMSRCWETKPTDRPTFEDLAECTKDILFRTPDRVYIDELKGVEIGGTSNPEYTTYTYVLPNVNIESI